jgi:tetratricopeptide (TPR) repeat protein
VVLFHFAEEKDMKVPYALIFCWLVSVCASAQGQQSPTVKATPQEWDRWKWTREAWTGDEKPYLRIRQQIDRLIAQGNNPEELAKKYKTQAKSWMKPLDQYRWSYAAYEAARKVNFKGQARRLQDIQDALQEAAFANPPRSYEYARLRFLSMVRLAPYNKLKVVGKRLVDENPKDYEVRFFYVAVLDAGLSIQDEKESLQHANALIKALPKKPTVYSLMGEVYYKIWLRTSNPSDADKAIAYYKKFMAMAPKDHAFQEGARKQIFFIRKLQEHKAKRVKAVR